MGDKDEEHRRTPAEEEGVGAGAGDERIRELEGQVDQLTTKLNRLKAENEELHQTIRRGRKMFPREFRELDVMDEQLKQLREEEVRPILETVEWLKKSLCKVNRENVRREAVTWRLTAKLSKLRGGGGREGEVDQSRRMQILDIGRDAVNIFPEEIWTMILDKVEDPRDRWSCYNTCSLFRGILHQWKTTWAFEQALPNLFPHLPRVKLLECRLVSRGWKETVDQILQNHPSLRPHNEESCNPRLLPFVDPQGEKNLDYGNIFCFTNRDDSDSGEGESPPLNDAEYTQKIRRKLFMMRTAYIVIKNFGDGWDLKHEQMWRDIYTFMKTFGDEIWHLNVYTQMDEIPSLQVRQKLLRFLFVDLFGFAPKLRRLTLDFLPKLGDEVIAVEMSQATLPSLPNLETLEMQYLDTGHQHHPILLEVLARYHTQLGRLGLDDSNCVWTTACKLKWPKLTELHLTVSSMDRLGLLSRGNTPNLTKLGLCFPRFGGESWGHQHSSQLFWILSEVPTTTRLSTLRLDDSAIKMLKGLGECPMPKCIIPHPDYWFLLHFPHLENLNVIYRAESVGEFALRCDEKLEENLFAGPPSRLERKMAKMDRERGVVEVNKYAYAKEMYKSNIWELLPRLQVFTFQWDIYTRGGYEDHCDREKRSEEGN